MRAKIVQHCMLDGVGVALLSYRMVWWVRCPQVRRIKSLSTVSEGDLLVSLAILDPNCSMAPIMLISSFTFPRTTLAIQPPRLGSEDENL